MELPIRVVIMNYLAKQNRPRTRAQIAAAMPDRQPNSVNRMLLDLVQRGVAVETNNGFALAPKEPVASTREDN